MMLSRIIPALTLAILVFGTAPAFADACSKVARAELDKSPGSELLSVKSRKNSGGKLVCVVRIKLASSDGKPGRVVTRTITP